MIPTIRFRRSDSDDPIPTMTVSSTPLALFDVDSRERAIAPCEGLLCARPRMTHLDGALGSLYAFAEQRALPLVFTTCCSGRRLAPGERPEVLHVPMDADDLEWSSRLAQHRLFHLEKPAYGDPKLNYERRAFDVFAHNANADRLVSALGDRRWVVFGNGLDLCVDSVVRALQRLGVPLTVVADVLVSSATGDADSKREILARYRREGIDTPTLAELLEHEP
jgi:nicotinamidase-related amidase